MNLSVDLCGKLLKNPVLTASGTFGSGIEYSEFVDLSKLGAVVTKGVSYEPWEGNKVPRICETKSGMLNAIGLQNPGVEVFCKRDLPFLVEKKATIVVNVCGKSEEDYCRVVERLRDEPVDILEINVSCPNVKEGGIAFGQDPSCLSHITEKVKKISKQPVIMKLSPNVTNIVEMAKAAKKGGADGVSLINTLTGMSIDIDRQCFSLANKTGGLSGPCIFPIALRMVYEVSQNVDIPILAMGGAESYREVVAFLLAGARAVSIGTANFYNPTVTMEIIEDLKKYMIRHNIEDINNIIGKVKEI